MGEIHEDEISAVGTMVGLLSDLTAFSEVKVEGCQRIYDCGPGEVNQNSILIHGQAARQPWEWQSGPANPANANTAFLYGMSLDKRLPGTVDVQGLFRLIEKGKISAEALVYFYQRAFEAASAYFRGASEKGEAFPRDYEVTESVFDSVVDGLEEAIDKDPEFKTDGDVYLRALGDCPESIESLIIHAVLDAKIVFLRNSAAGDALKNAEPAAP